MDRPLKYRFAWAGVIAGLLSGLMVAGHLHAQVGGSADPAAQVEGGVKGLAVESKIVHVTVYPEWAYVTRQIDVNLPAGSTRLTLDGLPAWIDNNSIRVQVEGAADLTILGESTQSTYLARANEAEIRHAEDEVTVLRDRIADLQGEIDILKQETEHLQGIRLFTREKLPHDASTRPIDVDEIRQMQTYMTEQLLANQRRWTELEREIRGLKPELTAKERKWSDLRKNVRLEQKQIAVELHATAATSAKIAVSYLISGASWYPVYDVRTTTADGRVQLVCQAVVQQSTGEDWSNAQFVLSTIQPYLTRQKPELTPWYIHQASAAHANDADTQTSASSRRYQVQSAQIGQLDALKQKQAHYNTLRAGQAVDNAWSQVQLNRSNLNEALKQIEERGTTVEFQIAGSYSVAPDGKPTSMMVGMADLSAERRYSAIPAVSQNTYVTGIMRNTGLFPVLPGEVKIYADGSFTGKSKMAFVAQGEQFELFLGLEERIKVTRKLDYRKSSTATWGKKKRLQAAYVIEVKNYLDGPAIVEVSDQIPVSQDGAITVKLENTQPRDGYTLNNGILTWPVQLAPRESKTLYYEFKIEYPEDVVPANIDALRRQIESK